jgi:hypothetical protein
VNGVSSTEAHPASATNKSEYFMVAARYVSTA